MAQKEIQIGLESCLSYWNYYLVSLWNLKIRKKEKVLFTTVQKYSYQKCCIRLFSKGLFFWIERLMRNFSFICENTCNSTLHITFFSVCYVHIKMFRKKTTVCLHYTILTFGEVAEANKGSKPPQAMIKLSANCEIKCTVLTTKIAFSPLLTKSKTDLVEWDLQTWISVSRENKTSDNNLWWM